jgi:hypothetical protein
MSKRDVWRLVYRVQCGRGRKPALHFFRCVVSQAVSRSMAACVGRRLCGIARRWSVFPPTISQYCTVAAPSGPTLYTCYVVNRLITPEIWSFSVAVIIDFLADINRLMAQRRYQVLFVERRCFAEFLRGQFMVVHAFVVYCLSVGA